MTDPINKNPYTFPPPADYKPITSNELSTAKSDNQSESAWAKMFPSGATKEELHQFINLYVQDLMREIKRTDKLHKENMARQKREEEGIY